MHKAILMHANIDERTELRHVGHHTLKDHARLNVGDLADALMKDWRDEALARVPARLAEFLENVVESECTGRKLRAVHPVEQARGSNNLPDRRANRCRNLLHHRIALRVHGSRIEGLGASADTQEPGGLLEGFRSHAAHFLQLRAGREATVLVPILNDIQRHALGDARHIAQQRPG